MSKRIYTLVYVLPYDIPYNLSILQLARIRSTLLMTWRFLWTLFLVFCPFLENLHLYAFIVDTSATTYIPSYSEPPPLNAFISSHLAFLHPPSVPMSHLRLSLLVHSWNLFDLSVHFHCLFFIRIDFFYRHAPLFDNSMLPFFSTCFS